MRHLFPLLLLASPALAQLPPGKDCYCWPPGARPGQTVEVVFGGSDWTPDVQFFLSDPRVKFEQLASPGEVLVPEGPFWFGIKSFDNDPRLPREVKAKLHLPADLPLGLIRWSVANANGAAAGGVFVVGKGDELTEDENRKGVQQLPSLPITVNGRLRRIEEIDRYQFTAERTGLVTVDLFARRLGNEFNGVLEIQSDGKKVAEAVDTEGVDPTVTFAVEKGNTYTVLVREVDHRGYRNFTYRLALTTGPRVVATLPACGRVGDHRPVEFVGYGVATGAAKLETVTAAVEFPRTAGTFTFPLTTPFGTLPHTFAVTELPESIEADGPTLPGPCGVTGRIGKRGKKDVYLFTGRKFEAWDIAVDASRIGSPVDAVLVLLGPDGKQLAANDGTVNSPDPRVSVTLPADGLYQVIVSDTSGKAPSLDSLYRLELQKPSPEFTLKSVEFVNVPLGGKAAFNVEAVRSGGFKGPVTLTLTGLPAGVTVPKEVVIPAGVPSVAVPLECAKDSGVSVGFVTVTGTAAIGDRPMSVAADRVLMATTLKPPFTVKSPEADGTRKVYRGSTHLADLVVERTDGFTGEILLDMAGAQQRHRQGIRGPVFKVAPGVKNVLYPVTLPEHLESTRTSRIGLVGMAKIADPKGKPWWVLTAMDGQVTMSVEGALMKLSPGPDEWSAVCGEPAAVGLKLARSPKLSGPVKVELLVPPELNGLVSAESVEWAADKTTGTLTLVSKADPKLAGVRTLTARGTATRDGHPVVSECEVEIEFTTPNSPDRK